LAWVSSLLFAWTGSNSFSTSRWSNIRISDCSSIPVEENPEFFAAAKTWCYEIQALRVFIWMTWAILFLIFVGLVMFCVGQSRGGSSHVWNTPISRFDPVTNSSFVRPVYSSTSGQNMSSTAPDYYWNPDVSASMPTSTAAQGYAFGSGGTAQMDNKPRQRQVVSSDLLGYSQFHADPFSSEPELISTLSGGPSADQWQRFPSAERYPNMGRAY